MLMARDMARLTGTALGGDTSASLAASSTAEKRRAPPKESRDAA
eukprot:CAMPEP_0197674286 /NCGR_PEP_ID=MMETSP1338-20131121/82607_1 /TAXON_ID=43686 ORGANISM="Pelagodinium beii, Strain RCC1491" /NCGR_SAMPLE_ID=MMETSP1338 /ASSEMBLY_ACC=CAM_ASM_000754 /LENGTH=43 /DNA_ID= /DNA_START= /DNA_END= /DNA_ORIENTATION=